MKCLQRSCCLLCALVLLSTVFSINAHAEEVDVPNYYVNHGINIYNASETRVDWKSINFTGYNGSQDNVELSNTYSVGTYATHYIESTYELGTNDPPIITKGGSASITLHDVYYGIGVTNTASNSFSYYRKLDSARLLITYTDNSTKYIDNVTTNLTDNKLTLSCDVVPAKDIKSIKFLVRCSFITTSNGYKFTYYLGEQFGADLGYKLSVDQQSEESGLLSGLLAKVTEFKDNVSNGFSNMLQSITELPQKIWTLISDGLKKLFVPSEDFIVQYKEDLDSMLEQKLGAVYQVVDITLESWDRISASDEQNTIELPETTIVLPEGNKFSFGGFDVKIVPDGFEMLANAIKLIGGICITILFVNGLRRRYDEVMGVEK